MLPRPVIDAGARKSAATGSDRAVHNAPMSVSNARPATNSAVEPSREVTPSRWRSAYDR